MAFVTVADVLHALYRCLREAVNHAEFAILSSAKQRAVAQSYMTRCESLMDPVLRENERRKGVKRIDFLMDRTIFSGLSTSTLRPNTLDLNLASRDASATAPILTPRGREPDRQSTSARRQTIVESFGSEDTMTMASIPTDSQSTSARSWTVVESLGSEDTMTIAPTSTDWQSSLADSPTVVESQLPKPISQKMIFPSVADWLEACNINAEEDLPPSPLFVDISFMADQYEEGIDTGIGSDVPPSPSSFDITFMADQRKESIDAGVGSDVPPTPSSFDITFMADQRKESIDAGVGSDVPPTPSSFDITFIPDWRKEGVEPEPDASPSSAIEVELVTDSGLVGETFELGR
jgi:hypothetical protein